MEDLLGVKLYKGDKVVYCSLSSDVLLLGEVLEIKISGVLILADKQGKITRTSKQVLKLEG